MRCIFLFSYKMFGRQKAIERNGYLPTKGGATVGAVGADCPHWQEAVGARLCFCPHKIWLMLKWEQKTGATFMIGGYNSTPVFDDPRIKCISKTFVLGPSVAYLLFPLILLLMFIHRD